jgi:hypothetical protein
VGLPVLPSQVVYWPAAPQVLVTAQVDVLHVRAMTEVPVHLDDLVVELTEADQNWLTLNAIIGLGWWPMTRRSPRRSQSNHSSACARWEHRRFVDGNPSARQAP